MLRSAGTYTIANLINAGVPFLLLPILTSYLTPSEYGIVAMFLVLTNGMVPFITLNSVSSISREYFERDKIDFPNFLTNSLYLTATSTLVLYMLVELTGEYISSISQFPRSWLFAVVLFALFQELSEVLLAMYRVQHKAVRYGIFRIIRTGLDMGLSLYFVIVLKRSWEGRIEGQFIAYAAFAAIAILLLYRTGLIKHGVNVAHLKKMLTFGIPLIPHVIGAVIITYSDRLFITEMIDLDTMGIYSVGYQIGLVIGLIQNSFNQAWQPWIYEQLGNEKSNKNRIVSFTYLYFLGLLALVMFLYFAAPILIKVFIGDEFQTAVEFVGWIGLGFAFNGMYKMVANYLFYLRKTKLIGVTTVCTALLNIVLNYFLISINGAIGAAQSTALSFFIQFIFVWILSSMHMKMPWFSVFSKNNN